MGSGDGDGFVGVGFSGGDNLGVDRREAMDINCNSTTPLTIGWTVCRFVLFEVLATSFETLRRSLPVIKFKSFASPANSGNRSKKHLVIAP